MKRSFFTSILFSLLMSAAPLMTVSNAGSPSSYTSEASGGKTLAQTQKRGAILYFTPFSLIHIPHVKPTNLKKELGKQQFILCLNAIISNVVI